jgi:hypothetical protein
LLWIDADALIANPSVRLESVIDEKADLLIAEDLAPSPINAGVFLLRNCARTLALLRLAYTKVQYLSEPTQDQPALAEALRECAPELRTRIVSRRLFNSFAAEYQRGDFVIHFAGQTPDAKLASITQFLARANAACGSTRGGREVTAPRRENAHASR